MQPRFRIPWTAAEALGQRVAWWLCQWAGWPPPSVRLLDVCTYLDPGRDAVCVEWRLSDGRTLTHAVDGLLIEQFARQLHQRGGSARLHIAREIASATLWPLVTLPPWERPRLYA